MSDLEIKPATDEWNASWSPKKGSGFFSFSNPKQTWRWSVFGGDLMVVVLNEDIPQPSWRQRFLTRILLGSQWERL